MLRSTAEEEEKLDYFHCGYFLTPPSLRDTSPIFCIAKHRGGGGNTSLVFIRFPYAVNGRPLYRFAIPCNAAGYGGERLKVVFLVFA